MIYETDEKDQNSNPPGHSRQKGIGKMIKQTTCGPNKGQTLVVRQGTDIRGKSSGQQVVRGDHVGASPGGAVFERWILQTF
jgi:hypothetical protein